jgi:parallel beta-helix repeat protein
MKTRLLVLTGFVLLFGWHHFLSTGGNPVERLRVISTSPSKIYLPLVLNRESIPLLSLSITLGRINTSNGISLDEGGDVDTKLASKGTPLIVTRGSGNGVALPSPDGNTIPDYYIQFNVDDSQLFKGNPTTHVRLEVDYFDGGTDTFSLQYDATSGQFAGGGSVVKTNTNAFKTAKFNLCDAYFGNRDNGADFRISDNGDGAEFIHEVRVIGLAATGPQTIKVDDFGANPFDNTPDSDAIQAALDSSCSGDTIVFTSGISLANYKGYLIDKTLFLTGTSAKHNLTFTSSVPSNHSLLRATAALKGYVVRLFARSRFSDAGNIDNINFGNINVDGGRSLRKCFGSDNVDNGIDDNWGSWLPECSSAGDPWCDPGNIAMDGGYDTNDPTQNYTGNPSTWTTGVVIHDLTDQQGECGSALTFFRAAGIIQNVTINTAGDHVHVAGCTHTDNDGDQGGWSDGITLFGPAQTVKNNTIINPSDVGIVFFGGKNTVISNNTVEITPGNYGAFAGIAVHPWLLGNVAGMQISGNHVTSAGSTTCGGLHAGINLGPQMWGGGCVNSSSSAMYGNSGSCSPDPSPATVGPCSGGACQIWAYLPASTTFTMSNNTVTGAQVNYLVDGFDILGHFVDTNNTSITPQMTDWAAAKSGCQGVTWGALSKVAHALSLPGYTDLIIHCER